MERFAIKIDKNLRANLYKICRLCGIDNPDKVKVLDDETIVNLEDGEPELWKKVLDCIGLLITKDDKMPQFMCTLCVDKINDFFEFREMCYATDGQTRKLLGIKDEPKLKASVNASTSSADCKTEDADIKLPVSVPVASAQRVSRKRRNADMEICNTSKEIKTDEADDIKPTASASTSASKKKRLKIEETDLKPVVDIKPGSASKLVLPSKQGPASKIGGASKIGLPKKRVKMEQISKEKKDLKPAKVSKLMKKKLKEESSALVDPEEQMQRKKKALELLKQRKLAKKVAVVKVEKLRKGSAESKIKEEAPVAALAPSPTQPKVKLKDKCAICAEGFVNKSLLEKHIRSTHIPTVARYHCVQCNETLKKNMEIKNHNLWHKLSKTPFQCGNCSESSCSIYTYSKHIRDCGQVAYLDAHIPDWHCPDCSEVFETTYLFNIHSCVSNTLVCPGCDRSLKWKEDYFKHIPTCPEAVHRIPPYMSSNIQVKNEAEHPSSPVPPHNTHSLSSTASVTLQPALQSRITPPLMDSNQCVVIPGNVNLHEEASSPTSKNGSRKSKRITKKDLKRFNKLLKSTMTTLVSIKQEPPQGEAVDDGDQSTSSDVRVASESPPGSPAPADDDFHHNDDDDSADEQTTTQPVGTIKQEIIDEGYRDLYNNIEVNIKREVVLNENRNAEVTPRKKADVTEVAATVESVTPKPVLKLKITKEHGTLNSILLDSPQSEKKKKKKRRKEEKLKAAEKEEANCVQEVATNFSVAPDIQEVAGVPDVSDAPGVPDVPDVVSNLDVTEEKEPAMPLPGIVHIKEEITEPEQGETEEEKLSSHSNHSTPSIVAATSGALQISCVSEGVHFNGAEEDDNEEARETEKPALEESENGDESMAVEAEPEKEIDIKPRLDELIPMLRIASVSSAEHLIEKTVKRKRRQTTVSAKPSTSTPQIVSVSSGTHVVTYQPGLEEPSGDGEESQENVDNNENIFDYTQVRIKEEVVDPTYVEEYCETPQDEEDEEEVEEEDEQSESTITEKEADENAYIANIDFNNLSIKQEKEYIDDGLDNAAGFDEDDSSDTDTETSSDTEDTNPESEREYRELPSEDDESQSEAIAIPALTPLGLQITAVHSEFTCLQPQLDEKTESQLGGQNSEGKLESNTTTEDQRKTNAFENKRTEEVKSAEEYSKIKDDIEIKSMHLSDTESRCQPTVSASEPLTANEVLHVKSQDLSKYSFQNEIDLRCEKVTIQTLTTTASIDEGDIDQDLSSTVLEIASETNETGVAVVSSPSQSSQDLDYCDQAANQPSTSTVAERIKILPSLTCGTEPKSLAFCDSVANTSHQTIEEVQFSTPIPDVSKANTEQSGYSSQFVDANACSLVPESCIAGEVASVATEVVKTTETLYISDDINNLIHGGIESRYTIATKAPQDASDIDRPIVQVPPDVGVLLERNVITLPVDTSCGSSNINQLIDQVPSVKTIPPHERETVALSCSASNISRLIGEVSSSSTAQSGYDLVSDIEPLVSEIDRLIDDTPSLAPTRNANLVVSHETMPVLVNVASEDNATAITDLATGDKELNRIKSQECSRYASHDQDTTDSLTGDLEKVESSIQNEICSTSTLNYPFDNRHKSKKFNSTDIVQQSISTEQAAPQYIVALPSISQGISAPVGSHIPTSISVEPTSYHADATAVENINEINIPINLTDVLSKSTLQIDLSPDGNNDFNQNLHMKSENATNSTDLHRLTSSETSHVEANLNFTELYRSTASLANLSELQVDLNPLTAGQFHTMTDVLPPSISRLSDVPFNSSTSNTCLSVPVLSEEVQNLLNEGTVAANNFEINESILRARCSTSTNAFSPPPPVAVSVQNFTDLENVNEIAENNNNANIERELQDELGNVLAAAIADRSPNDEADDNNAMNENRANFEIT